VTYRVCVHGHAHDGPHWVDASGERALAGAFTRARSIERGDGAVGSAHVPVKYVARIKVISSNRTYPLRAKVPCPEPVPAPGASNVMKVPSRART
jgi:hypothetical protein